MAATPPSGPRQGDPLQPPFPPPSAPHQAPGGYAQAQPGQHVAAGGPSGPRAGFWQRVGAYLLDAILIAIVTFALTAALKGAGQVLGIIIGIGYWVYFEGSPAGQTLGKKALGIRVIDFSTGGPIGYGRAFLRYIGKILSAIPIGLGFLWMLWDGEKQTWDDKLSTAVVVPVTAYPVNR